MNLVDKGVEQVVSNESLFAGSVVRKRSLEKKIAVFMLKEVELLGVKFYTTTSKLVRQLFRRLALVKEFSVYINQQHVRSQPHPPETVVSGPLS